jgi:hypothetical protein
MGQRVNRPLFLSVFNQSSILSTDFSKNPQNQISLKSVHWEWNYFIWTFGQADRYEEDNGMAPGSSQPLTELSTINISWRVKVAGE